MTRSAIRKPPLTFNKIETRVWEARVGERFFLIEHIGSYWFAAYVEDRDVRGIHPIAERNFQNRKAAEEWFDRFNHAELVQ